MASRKRKCNSRDCAKKFAPISKVHRFCSVTCQTREKVRRFRAKQK